MMLSVLLPLVAVIGLCAARPNDKHVQEPLISTEIHPDFSVTFRFRTTQAAVQVSLKMEGRDPTKMSRDAAGTWSTIVTRVMPDIYGYSFSVDGTDELDPLNPILKPNLLTLGNLLLVPGKPALDWEEQGVPRGVLHHHFFRSKLIGDDRDYFVYTPPGYEARESRRYPVLYLLHGYSDSADGWSAVGRANVILDNLIAKGTAVPMIVVMPLGYGLPNFVTRQGSGLSDADRTRRSFDNFRASLFEEVMPAVEHEYRVDVRSAARAIAGLSMGGAETLWTSLNRPGMFDYVGAFSAGGLPQDFTSDFPSLDVESANKLKVFTITCGTEDGLIGTNRDLVRWLQSKHVKVQLVEKPGRHTWMVWRRDLIEFASRLFR
jgi:enterochelin esterase family protein